jgi:hypothetical protein
VIYWYKVHARTVMSVTNIKLKWILNNLKNLKQIVLINLSLISTNQPANYVFPTIHMILVFLEIVLGFNMQITNQKRYDITLCLSKLSKSIQNFHVRIYIL